MEFRLSATTRKIGYAFSAALFLIGIFLIGLSFSDSRYSALIGIALTGIALYLWRERKLSRLILDDNSITLTDSMSSTKLTLNDIKGFRKLEKGGFEILPLPGNDKKITISKNFENRIFIESWLEDRMPDIDAAIIQQQTESILENEDFGPSVIEREAKLKQAKKIVSKLKIATYVIAFWGLIYPMPYNFLMFLLLLLPFIAFASICYFKGGEPYLIITYMTIHFYSNRLPKYSWLQVLLHTCYVAK